LSLQIAAVVGRLGIEAVVLGNSASPGRYTCEAVMYTTRQISEADWKLFRRLRELALERFCEGALAELARIAANAEQRAHQRYLAAFRRLQRRDKELAQAFDTPRRSAAWQQLALIRSRGLLTDEEFASFSAETHAAVQVWMGD
jgi:mannitol-1-phosphate/altronate dehydrogenase